MPQRVLSEDWSDYDDRKKRHTDAQYFSCEEFWERDYLVKKIRDVYPQYSETAIKAAITACCQEVPAPRPRTRFVECVMKRLRS